MTASTSQSDFEAAVRRSGMNLTAGQLAEIYTGWKLLQPVLARLGNADRAREAEPAHAFDPEQRL